MPPDVSRPISSEDVAVSLAVRDDLGPGHDPAVVAEFLDRVGPAIDSRVDARLAAARLPRAAAAGGASALASWSMGVASLALGIPISAVAVETAGGGVAGVFSLIVAWTGIAAVNVAHARRR